MEEIKDEEISNNWGFIFTGTINRKSKIYGNRDACIRLGSRRCGRKECRLFYPISIVEKDEILKRCREIGIDGICTIASDLAVITVNYVANNMGLTANSIACTEKSTNKHLMRAAFEKMEILLLKVFWCHQ